jgi:hypothetical protein
MLARRAQFQFYRQGATKVELFDVEG